MVNDPNLPPWTPVGRFFEWSVSWDCTISGGTTQFGFGHAFSGGANFIPTGQSIHLADNEYGSAAMRPVYTTNVLQAHGLGFVLFFNADPSGGVPVPLLPSTWPLANTTRWPVGYLNLNTQSLATGTFRPRLRVLAHYVKISNAFGVAPIPPGDTDGPVGTLPLVGSIPLGGFFVTDSQGNLPSAAQHSALALTMPQIKTRARTCSTSFEKTVFLPQVLPADFAAVGSVAGEREFTLTFACPHGFNLVGFTMEPVFGSIGNPADGVFAIKTFGDNSHAQGVALKLWVNDRLRNAPINGGQGPSGLAPDLQPARWNTRYWMHSYRAGTELHQNLLNAIHNYTTPMKVAYIRTGTVTPGKVESAIIIHMVYK